ncbi:MAG: penicillin-binding protein activator [Candidatus Magasanikbacteria bacterium]
MNTKNKIIALITVVMVVVIGVNFYKSNNSSNSTNISEPIKIGFILPLSGEIASLGENIKDGAVVAANEINQVGGINGRKLELVFEDGKCNLKDGVNAANKLINIDKVPILISGCSDETLGAAPLAEQSHTIILTPVSTNPKITTAGDYIFRLIPSDSFQGKFAADYLYDTLSKRKVAILFNTDKEWSVGVKTVFEKRFLEKGGQIVANEGVTSESRDLRTTLEKIKVSQPDVVYAPTFIDSGIVLLKQSTEIGLDTQIFGGDVWDDAKFGKEAGISGNGARFSVVSNRQNPQFFIDAMSALPGGKDINAYAPRAYDAVKIVSNIFARVGTDTEKIKNELYKINNYIGIADTYSIDNNGDLSNAQYSIKEFQNGQIIDVK